MADISIHVYHHILLPNAGTSDVTGVLEEMKAELKEAIAALNGEVADSNGKLDSILKYVVGVPDLVAAAVAQALADNDVDQAAATASVNEARQSISDNVDKVVAAINTKPTTPGEPEVPPPPPQSPPAPPAEPPANTGAVSVSPSTINNNDGTAISVQLSVSGGVAPYTYNSDLAEVSVDANGLVTGMPTSTQNGTITVTDSSTPPQTFTVPVNVD